MLFRTTFANEQLNHLRDKQSLRWKISEDTSLSFNIRIWFDLHTKQKCFHLLTTGGFCSSVGFNTARFIIIGSLKTDTRNVFFILRPKMFFSPFICLIKGIKILQTFLTIYFRFCFVDIFYQPSGKAISLYF
jgi:hypothetical protein